MARLGLLCLATLAMVLVTSAAPCHDKGEVSTGAPIDGLDYLDNDIGNFESDDDLGGSDDELGADELSGGFDPSELDDDRDFGEGGSDDFPEEDLSNGDFPEDDFSGPDREFGAGDGFDPDCLDGHGGHGGHDGHGRGSLINLEAGYIGTGNVELGNILDQAAQVTGLELTDDVNGLDIL